MEIRRRRDREWWTPEFIRARCLEGTAREAKALRDAGYDIGYVTPYPATKPPKSRPPEDPPAISYGGTPSGCNEIINAICVKYGTNLTEMRSQRRTSNITKARLEVILAILERQRIKNITGIGRFLNRDASTIRHYLVRAGVL